MRLAVVGGGWAGLAAAVRACEAGHEVTLFEMAQQLGGRARSVDDGGSVLDNGQHILIGAYRHTFGLLRTLGCAEEQAFRRLPLELRYPDGRGLALPAGPAWISFVRGVARCAGWRWADRSALIRAAAGWALDGFRCAPDLTVEALSQGLPPAVRRMLIEPLCVAALNTSPREASAQVLLRVLREALFGGRGAADLLLPRRPLGEVLPEPAARWLRKRGARIHLGRRVDEVRPAGGGWGVAGEPFDAAILACAPWQAAKLAAGVAPAWARAAAALQYEPIVTVYLDAPGARWPVPMLALEEGPQAPAQFAFDHGLLGREPGRFAFVVSGARAWLDRGPANAAAAVAEQARRQLPPDLWHRDARLHRVLVEKRATFRCSPGLVRPPTHIADGLAAAGDYVDGPFPATLESAIRSGEFAFRHAAARFAMQNQGHGPPGFGA